MSALHPNGDALPVRRGFVRTLVFGVFAALGVPAVRLLAAPVLGFSAAFALYFAALAVAYLICIAGTPRRAAAVTLLSVPAAVFAIALGGEPLPVALAAATIVALGRSAFLYRSPQPRLFVVETLLLVTGVTLAGAVASPGVWGATLAVWTWFLVQSAWFLVARPRSFPARAPGDGFERARERLETLLDEWEGDAA